MNDLTTSTLEYQKFLAAKQKTIQASGIDVPESEINPKLFLFQRDIVRWALKLGKSALFEECGLGKTAQQLEWARLVAKHTGGKVLILAPLAVAYQTVEEGVKFGVTVKQVKEQSEVGDSSIVITNYDRLHLFDPSQFIGVVLDESSILKNFTGKIKRAILDAFERTPYKLACTATPAPNDHLELGNHAAFLDVMEANEMISRWFINDTMEAGNYRLKEHAAKDFWRWLTSWAVCLSKPGDLGDVYALKDFDLPELKIHEHRLNANKQSIDRAWAEGRLMPDDSPSSTGMHKVKRESLVDRIAEAKAIVSKYPADATWIIWCDTDYEADALIEAFPDAIEVRGSMKPETKETLLKQFSDQQARMIITKPDLAGFGLNWQHCPNQLFIGVSYSFEKTYQALRRSYRFGQKLSVNAHMVYAETEGNIITILNQKQGLFSQMQTEMNEAMKVHGLFRDTKRATLSIPNSKIAKGENWTMILGDCVTETRKLEDNSIDFCIHSPPFANLYIYSDSEADMGNSADDDEFFTHYEYLIKELFRVTVPGRLCAVHCKDLPSYMNRDGAAGLVDFPGKIIKAFEKYGWQYHSRVTIWKDPVIEMQRTKNHGLLHKNFVSTADAVRQGMPDYMIVFRKWPLEGSKPVKQKRVPGDYIGTNAPNLAKYRQVPSISTGGMVSVPDFDHRGYSIDVWQRYASPVWFDIDQTNVLNYQMAKDSQDEKHICPLQLDVIARSVDLWTNKGDTVFSPFAGIGSEGYESIKLGRKFIGIELKESYWKHAQKYLADASRMSNAPTLFDLLPAEAI